MIRCACKTKRKPTPRTRNPHANNFSSRERRRAYPPNGKKVKKITRTHISALTTMHIHLVWVIFRFVCDCYPCSLKRDRKIYVLYLLILYERHSYMWFSFFHVSLLLSFKKKIPGTFRLLTGGFPCIHNLLVLQYFPTFFQLL